MRRGARLAADAPTVVQGFQLSETSPHAPSSGCWGHFWLGCALQIDERLPEYFFNTAFIINLDGEIFREP